MGLFDSLFSDENAANMALATGLLGGRGSFNQVASQALMGAQGAGQSAAARKRQADLDALQRQRLQLALDEDTRKKKQYDSIEQFRQSIPDPSAPFSIGTTPDAASQVKQTNPLNELAYQGMKAGAVDPMDWINSQRKQIAPTITSTAPGAVSHYFDQNGILQTIQGPAAKLHADSPDIQALKLLYGEGTPDFMRALKASEDKKNATVPQGFNRDENGKLAVDPEWLKAQIQIHQAGANATAAGRIAQQENAMLSPEDKGFMAQQFLAGDKSVLQNLGRGNQGAANIVALRSEIRKQATDQGMTGADVAAKMAEYAGLTSSQRTIGTRTANIELAASEAEKVIPLAKAASDEVARSGFLPFGKGDVMFNQQTNDPAMRKFAAANNALVNVYSRAIAPTGTPTVHDKEHARDILSTAFDQKSYNAVLEQMQLEINAARSAPKDVRKSVSDAITGRQPATQPTGNAIDDLVNKYRTR